MHHFKEVNVLYFLFLKKGQFPIPSSDGDKKTDLPKLDKCPNKISLEMSLG